MCQKKLQKTCFGTQNKIKKHKIYLKKKEEKNTDALNMTVYYCNYIKITLFYSFSFNFLNIISNEYIFKINASNKCKA